MRIALVIIAHCLVITSAGSFPPLASLSWITQNVNSTDFSTNRPVSTTVVNGTIYTANYNEATHGTLVATNGTTGYMLWWINLMGQPVWVSNSRGTVVVATTSYVASVSRTGSTIWKFSFPDGYRLSTRSSGGPQPVWLDADSFVAFVSLSNSHARLYHFNAATGQGTSLWNSSTRYPSNLNCGLNGPTTVGSIGGSLFVVQVLQASQFVAINISNSTRAQLLSFSGDITNTNGTASIFNSTIYFGGTDYNNSYAKIVGYAFNGSLVFSASWPALYKVENFERFSFANGSEGIAVVARTGTTSACSVFSIDLNGNPITPMLSPNTYDQRCYLMTTDSNSFYLNDNDLNIMRYSFGGSNWSWIAPSMFAGTTTNNSFGPTANAVIIMGKLYLQKPLFFNGSSTVIGALVEVNTFTGAYTSFLPTPISSLHAIGFIVFDPDSLGGSIVCVGESDFDGVYLFNMLPNPGPSVATWVPQPMYGVPYVYAGKVYFVATNTVYCFGLLNGTLLWSQYVAGLTVWPFTFDKTVRPIIAGGLLYVLAIYPDPHLYVFDYLNRVPYFSVVIPSTITNCAGPISTPITFVNDPTEPTSPWVYFAGGSGACIVRFNAVGSSMTATWEAAKGNTDSIYAAPSVGADYVWYVDISGYTFWQRKSMFTSTLSANNMKCSSPLPVDFTYPSPLTRYAGTVFVTFQGQLVGYDATTLIPQTTTIVGSVDYSRPPIIFNDQLFLTTFNGSFVSYGLTPSAASTSLPLRFSFSAPAAWQSFDLGVPVVSPFGLFVFANEYGILGVDWNGNLKFTIPGWCCNDPSAIREGIAYIVCSGQLVMIDVLRGKPWKSGPLFGYGNPTVIIDTSSELSLGVFTIFLHIINANNLTQWLYQPNQLPPSLNNTTPPATGIVLQEPEQSRLWIAGLVGGLVVLIFVVAIAVKVGGGGKKRSNYVAVPTVLNQEDVQ